MTGVRVVGPLDPTLAWDGGRLYDEPDLAPGREVSAGLRGAAGSVQGDGRGFWRIVRDPLGLDKLFWARGPAGEVAMAARPYRLIREGWPLDRIEAIPRGTDLTLGKGGERGERSLVPPAWSSGDLLDQVEAGRRIRAALEGYLDALQRRHASTPAYVCLSGGLDSSGIAALAGEFFPEVVAVSFDLGRSGPPSDDRRAGQRVARELGLPLLEVSVEEEELLSHLDTVLLEGIDWRDFNVHAGLVNAALADGIAAARAGAEGPAPLVFTGDLPNEFLVDYRPERYRGSTYYQLPRLSPRALRANLVRGLDTCHREVGVFGAWGLRTVQPYAVAVDAYMSLPEDLLRAPDRKEELCRAIFGDRVPSFVYTRPKARAQLGGEGGGVLGMCLDRGVDAAFLRRRFAELHGERDPECLDRVVRAGRYRASTPPPELEAHERA